MLTDQKTFVVPNTNPHLWLISASRSDEPDGVCLRRLPVVAWSFDLDEDGTLDYVYRPITPEQALGECWCLELPESAIGDRFLIPDDQSFATIELFCDYAVRVFAANDTDRARRQAAATTGLSVVKPSPS